MSTTDEFVERLLGLLHDIDLGPEHRILTDRDGDRVYLQIYSMRRDVATGRSSLQKGGKRYLSKYMADNEIVQLVLDATIAFEVHEIRENFLFKGKRIYGPHLALDALLEIADRVELRAEL